MTLDQAVILAVLALPGFTACAEFGSYAFVHPVLRRLDVPAHIEVERGLVRTFGRVMPVLMPLSLVVLIVWASTGTTPFLGLPLVAVILWAVGLITTVLVNVRINAITSGWTPDRPADEWRAMRRRWEAFQGVRSWAFLLSFFAVALAVAIRPVG